MSPGPAEVERRGIAFRPLYPAERDLLTRWLEDPDLVLAGGPWSVDPKRLTLFTYETGMHTDDLVHPDHSKLHVADDGRIVRVRAKKDIGATDSWIVLTPHHRIPWYREFIRAFPVPQCNRLQRQPLQVRRRVRGIWTPLDDLSGRPVLRATCHCAVPFEKLIRRCCSAAGLEGAGMLTLRHTFGCRWYELTRDINVVKEKMGCSTEVALRYAKLVGQERWDKAGADLDDQPQPYEGDGVPSLDL